jgi:hypothetical protein
MAFPTTGLLDNFDRANEGPPPSTNWTTAVLSGAGTGHDGVEVAGSGQLKGNGSADNFGQWNVQTFGPDSEVFCAIDTMADTLFCILYLGLLNIGANTTDGYCLRFDKEAATDEFNIGRIDNGAITFLHAGVQQELTLTDSIGFERIGSTLTGYHKPVAGSWTQILQVSDSTYTSAGHIGIMLRGGTMLADDFGGGTVVPAGSGGGTSNLSLTGAG